MTKEDKKDLNLITDEIIKNIEIIKNKIKLKYRERKEVTSALFENKSFTFGEYEKWRKETNI